MVLRDNACQSLRESWEETAFMVCFWSTVLHRIHKVSKAMQSGTVDMLLVRDLYGSLEQYFMEQRNHFNYFEELAADISKITSYEKDTKRQPKRKVWPDEDRSEEVISFPGRNDLKINTFLPIIDSFVCEFKRRKTAYDEFQCRFYFLA